MSNRTAFFLHRHFNNGHVLGGLAFLILPASVFSIPFVTPLLCVGAAFALVVTRLRGHRWPSVPAPLSALLVLLLLYGLLSALWAVEPGLTLKLVAQLLGLFAAGLVLLDAAQRLDPGERDFFERAFLAGFVGGVALLLFEILSDATISEYFRNLRIVQAVLGDERPIEMLSHFSRTATLVGLLAWPAATILSRRGGWLPALAAILFAAVPIFVTFSETAKIAFIAGGAVYIAALWRPHRAAGALGALICVGVLAAPLVLRSSMIGWAPSLMPSLKVGSLDHRIAIWDFVTSKIAERPWFGWGLNSSRVIPGGHTLVAHNAEALPLHPHDMALQIWLELGVPGVLIALALILIVTGTAARLKYRRSAQAAALAVIATAATNAVAGYDLWHPWWLSFLWLSTAVTVAAVNGPSPERAAGPG